MCASVKGEVMEHLMVLIIGEGDIADFQNNPFLHFMTAEII